MTPRLRRVTPVALLPLALLTGAGTAPVAAAAPEATTTADETATATPDVRRHAGDDRYATAAALADTVWRDFFWDPDHGQTDDDKVVVVTSGQDFPDALAGGPLASAWGGPILLTKQDRLPAVTAETLAGLEPDYVVVLGGPEAVSEEVVEALAEHVAEPERVSRIDGADRYEVAATIARTVFVDGFSTRAYVALGTDWPDGLAGGAAAGYEYAPLLLTRPDDVPAVVMETLADLLPEEIVLLGGPSAVSDTALAELELVAPVVRIGGDDRYAVAAHIADLHPSTAGATVASGENWPDALAGSAFAGLVGDKLLLLRSGGVPGATARTVQDQGLVLIEALGGTVPLPEAVLDELRAIEVVG